MDRQAQAKLIPFSDIIIQKIKLKKAWHITLLKR